MDEKLIKLDDIYKKIAFIYEVDGGYHYIGWGVCKPCNSNDAIKYYEGYKRNLSEIGVENLPQVVDCVGEDQNPVENLRYCYNKVKAYSENEIDYKDLLSFRKKIESFIDELPEDQKENLQKQLRTSVKVFYYCFWRA